MQTLNVNAVSPASVIFALTPTVVAVLIFWWNVRIQRHQKLQEAMRLAYSEWAAAAVNCIAALCEGTHPDAPAEEDFRRETDNFSKLKTPLLAGHAKLFLLETEDEWRKRFDAITNLIIRGPDKVSGDMLAIYGNGETEACMEDSSIAFLSSEWQREKEILLFLVRKLLLDIAESHGNLNAKFEDIAIK